MTAATAIERGYAELAANVARVGEYAAEFERHLTDAQRHARAMQEAAMRADRLRGLPSAFGELED